MAELTQTTPVGRPWNTRSRLAQDRGVSGRNVRVTNPQYAKRQQRTRSIGMKGVPQRGRVQDV